MRQEKIQVANWGNFPVMDALVYTPGSTDECLQVVQTCDTLIARGNGKCYGDAALSSHLLSTLSLNNILHFDAAQGIIDCEAGVLLADVLRIAVPKGWFFHVTPGIKNITVGGAVASDVHGKNHPVKGCFSNFLLSFQLMRADGSVVTCSKAENSDLFWQTCGGMGWTGIILSARFQLMRISSTTMRQRTVRADTLDALLRAFEEHRGWTYGAGWLDALASGSSFGRGVLYLAEHEEAQVGEVLQFEEQTGYSIPFYAPSWLLNPLSIRAHNAMLFSKGNSVEGTVGMDRYFYPLDKIGQWNRLYGRRGFVQYQFCLPENHAFDGLKSILETIKKSSDTPFLSVLKRHGERPAEAIHSFPEKGYSLALDFPRTRTVEGLVNRLDEVVWQHDGKIYLTKDALSAPRMGRVNPRDFGEAKFFSSLKGRLLAGPPD
ncbi:MAG: FAD-binding oxidoreductase [Saprospiraceae bacterium]|nr:FAD-binding oxidoreductase [Saprospiraceae bacterium]